MTAYPEQTSSDERWKIQDPHGQCQTTYGENCEGLLGVVRHFHGSTPSLEPGTGP